MKYERGTSRDDILDRLVDSQMKKGTEYMAIEANVLSQPLSYIELVLDKKMDIMEKKYAAFSKEERTRGLYTKTEAEELGDELKLRDEIAREIRGFVK